MDRTEPMMDVLDDRKGAPEGGIFRPSTSIAMIAVMLLGTACGGGSGTSPEEDGGPSQPGDVQSLAINYQYLVESNSLGSMSIGGPVRDLGDDETGMGMRIVVEFPMAELPANATITEATLSLTFLKVLGDPFGKLGDLQVVGIEHTPGSIGDEFVKPVLAHDPTSDIDFITTPSRPAIDVTEVVSSRVVAGDASVRLRVQFPTPSSGDSSPDLVSIATKIGSLPPPVLEIKYTTP